MNQDDLKALSNVDLKEIDTSLITDIQDIKISQENGKYERIKAYLENTYNPYFVKCDDVIVKMSFSQNPIRLDNCIERYLIECLNDRL